MQEVNRKWILVGIKGYLEIASKMAKDDNALLLIYRNGSSEFITLSGKKAVIGEHILLGVEKTAGRR